MQLELARTGAVEHGDDRLGDQGGAVGRALDLSVAAAEHGVRRGTAPWPTSVGVPLGIVTGQRGAFFRSILTFLPIEMYSDAGLDCVPVMWSELLTTPRNRLAFLYFFLSSLVGETSPTTSRVVEARGTERDARNCKCQDQGQGHGQA